MERNPADTREEAERVIDVPPDDADEPGSPSGDKKHRHKDKKHKKEKKNKKEKEHKHKHKKDKVKHRDKEGGEQLAEPAADAAAEEPDAANSPAETAEAAAQPLSPPANGAAELLSAAAAGSADHEEGELPETLPDAEPPSPRSDAGQEAQEGVAGRHERDRPSKKSRSKSPAHGLDRDRGRERHAADRERSERDRREKDRGDRDRGDRPPRSPGGSGGKRDRSPRREPEGGRAPVDERRREDDGRPSSRDRPPSRDPRSRSPDRRAELVDRSRRDDHRDRARLPPRPYDRDRGRPDVDRRRGPEDWRRMDADRRRGPGGWEDRSRLTDGGPGRRSRSRSRERSKRDRSASRERQRRDGRRQAAEEEDVEEFQRRVAAALEGQADDDEDRLIEERRRRRQEILAKHREQQQLSESIAAPTATALRRDVSVNFQPDAMESAPPTAPPTAPPSMPPSAAPSAPASPRHQAAPTASPGPSSASARPGGGGAPPTPEPGASDEEEAEQAAGEGGVLDIWKHDEEEQQAAGGGEEDVTATQSAAGTKTGIGEDDGELAKRVGVRRNVDVDMFAEEDDIFAATPAEAKAAAGQAGVVGPAAAGAAAAIRKGLLDNYDDHEGYYNFQVGEVVADKFEVVVSLGKGVFSSVLKARDISRKDLDTNQHPEVAIKVIRANETMYKAGQMEKVILRKLSEADKEGRRHCIRMISSFEYRNHLCLVFESMDLNLRELTKRYGRGIGLSINAVRIYAQQMLVGLHHLKNCGVLHADIKPDNILVNDRRTVVKLCDFGSAMFTGDNEITPYLVSRFYRPPEVILGLPYDHPMDIWSVGCVVYELFTGHILFSGKTNNEMLKLMMDVKGPFPKKMLKKAEFGFKHFENDPNMSFALLEEDPVNKRPVRRLIPNPAVKKDFAALLAGQSPDRRKLAQLADLLERMMTLDPDKRITPKDALRHAFIKEPPAPPPKA